MTYDQFRELVPLYVLGALDGTELAEFERHVAGSRSRCEPELAEWQACADQIALAAPAVEPSPAVLARVMDAVEDRRAPVRPQVRVFDWRDLFAGWIPWSATAVLFVVVAGLTLSRQRYKEQAAEAAQQRTVLMRQLDELQAGNVKLAAEKEDYVLGKQTYSAFYETPLDSLLRAHDVHDLVIAGLHSNICCRHTSADAFFRGIQPIVPEDGVESLTEEAHREGLEYIKTIYQGDITDTANVLRRWR